MPLPREPFSIPALIVYDRFTTENLLLTAAQPFPLLPVGNRLLMEHQIEWLSDQGIKAVSLSLGKGAEKVESTAGPGHRWGVQLRTSLNHSGQPLSLILKKEIPFAKHGLLVVEGAALVHFQMPLSLKETTRFVTGEQVLPVMFLTPDDLTRVAQSTRSENVRDLAEEMAALCPNAKTHQLKAIYFPLIGVPDYELINRNLVALGEAFLFKGSLDREGVRLGIRSRISSRAVIVPPVVIGDETIILEGSHIGPLVSIGDQCFIESGTHLSEAVVGPQTYVGKNTAFHRKFLAREQVLDFENQTGITVADGIIIGDIRKPLGMRQTAEKLLGGLLFFSLLGPIAVLSLVHFLRFGTWFDREEILRLPAKPDLSGELDLQWCNWHRFRFRAVQLSILPSLWDVARGRLSLVGNPPITRALFQQMDEVWKPLRLSGFPGITGLPQQMGGSNLSPEEQISHELYYQAKQSFHFDTYLFFRGITPYFLRKLFSLIKPFLIRFWRWARSMRR